LKSKVYLINNKEYLTESISSLFDHITVGYSNKTNINLGIRSVMNSVNINFILSA